MVKASVFASGIGAVALIVAVALGGAGHGSDVGFRLFFPLASVVIWPLCGKTKVSGTNNHLLVPDPFVFPRERVGRPSCRIRLLPMGRSCRSPSGGTTPFLTGFAAKSISTPSRAEVVLTRFTIPCSGLC
jgi:hypothetical protein